MIPAKIRLSKAELELVNQSEWILTKNQILLKVQGMLGELLELQKEAIKKENIVLPAGVSLVPGKISKGENYKGLPYLILDHPRYFEKENVFALRTLFWWGNFFSVTLHLSGKCRDQAEENMLIHFQGLSMNGYHIGIHASEWEHHFEKDNYCSIDSFTENEWKEFVKTKSYYKIAKKFSLNDWDDLPEKLMKSFVELAKYFS